MYRNPIIRQIPLYCKFIFPMFPPTLRKLYDITLRQAHPAGELFADQTETCEQDTDVDKI